MLLKGFRQRNLRKTRETADWPGAAAVYFYSGASGACACAFFKENFRRRQCSGLSGRLGAAAKLPPGEFCLPMGWCLLLFIAWAEAEAQATHCKSAFGPEDFKY